MSLYCNRKLFGKTLSKEYFQPVGDLDILILYPISFSEFAASFGLLDEWSRLDLSGSSSHEIYDRVYTCYKLYIQIGGYPSVVKRYIETEDIAAAIDELERIIQVFISESESYFQNILELNVFEQIMPAIAQLMIRDRKGRKAGRTRSAMGLK